MENKVTVDNPVNMRSKHNDIIRECKNREHKTGERNFFALCNPKTQRKKRICLKCRNPFMSENFGNRRCGRCDPERNRANSAKTPIS